MKRLILVLLVAGLGASACAARALEGPGPVNSGIRGRTMAGPTCPVERLDSPCPDRPVSATIVVKDASGQQVATVRSGSDGRFKIRLAPGTYVLDGTQPSALHRVAKPTTVTVRSGQFTNVTITFDTGIR